MRTVNILGIALIAILILLSCGHTRKLTTSFPDSATASASASTPNPQWLTDALAELEAYERPADVKPSIFADLKTELTRLLRERASGRLVSSISADYTHAYDLQFRQDSASADVYLTWGYVNLGDYDQSGTVAIADITPIAQQYEKEWFDVVAGWDPEYAYIPGYSSIVGVVDGNLNGEVDFDCEDEDPNGDLLPLAQNFGNSVTTYTVYGSDDPEGPEHATWIDELDLVEDQVEIGSSPFGGRLRYEFNVSDLSSQYQFAYYWVQPDDGQNPGGFSDSYREDDEDETPNPEDLRPVVATVYPSEHLVQQKGTDVTFSYTLSDEGPRPGRNGISTGQRRGRRRYSPMQSLPLR